MSITSCKQQWRNNSRSIVWRSCRMVLCLLDGGVTRLSFTQNLRRHSVIRTRADNKTACICLAAQELSNTAISCDSRLVINKCFAYIYQCIVLVHAFRILHLVEIRVGWQNPECSLRYVCLLVHCLLDEFPPAYNTYTLPHTQATAQQSCQVWKAHKTPSCLYLVVPKATANTSTTFMDSIWELWRGQRTLPQVLYLLQKRSKM